MALLVNQALFMRSFFNIAEQRGLEYFVMEAFDQPWKTSFEGRAAGHWGMYDLDRQPKWSLTGPVQETPAWLSWALGASLFDFNSVQHRNPFFGGSSNGNTTTPGRHSRLASSELKM